LTIASSKIVLHLLLASHKSSMSILSGIHIISGTHPWPIWFFNNKLHLLFSGLVIRRTTRWNALLHLIH
jgi:hypothetical protein